MDFFAQQRIIEGSSSPADELADEENNYCPFCNGSGKGGLDMNGNESECVACKGSGEGLFVESLNDDAKHENDGVDNG